MLVATPNLKPSWLVKDCTLFSSMAKIITSFRTAPNENPQLVLAMPQAHGGLHSPVSLFFAIMMPIPAAAAKITPLSTTDIKTMPLARRKSSFKTPSLSLTAAWSRTLLALLIIPSIRNLFGNNPAWSACIVLLLSLSCSVMWMWLSNKILMLSYGCTQASRSMCNLWDTLLWCFLGQINSVLRHHRELL